MRVTPSTSGVLKVFRGSATVTSIVTQEFSNGILTTNTRGKAFCVIYRTVAMASLQGELPNGLRTIYERFGEKVKFQVFDRRGGMDTVVEWEGR